MNRIQTITSRNYGPDIERIARQFASVCVTVYVAGFMFGTWLHNLNDRLAGRTPAVIQTDATKAEPITKPVTKASSTVAQLRRQAQLVGIPRSVYRTARKAQLLELLG